MPNAPLPMIVSIDDHAMEPPDVWQCCLPVRFRDRGPRVEQRGIAHIDWKGAVSRLEVLAGGSPTKCGRLAQRGSASP